ncbi:MAG: tetratricopeptide repeat protein [Spirochaetota bacterium]
MKYIQNTTRALLLALMLIQCGEDESLTAKKKYKVAVAYFYQQKLDLALKEFRATNKAQPGYKNTNLYLGKIHYYNTNFQKALTYFQIYAKYHPDNSKGLFWIVKTEYIRKKIKPQELLTLVNKYLQQNSSNLEILYIKAELLQGMQRTGEAVMAYRSVIQNSNFLKASYLHLADIYQKENLPNKARYYRRIGKALSTQMKNYGKKTPSPKGTKTK